eukprot:10852.XXX_25703_24779_1 [CDS] Oithona nana genome sequencing.
MSKKLELCDLPQELLYDILIRIPDQNWLAFGLPDVNQSPSLTCKRWKALISSKSFWRRYHSYWHSKVPQQLFQSELPWQYFASISLNHIYEKNLILNVSGELTSSEEFIAQENRTLDEEHLMSPWPIYPFWKIWSSAGQGWKVVQGNDLPVNAQVFFLYPKVKPPPLDYFTHCFFTSYHSCSKEQTIDLQDILQCKQDFLLQKSRFQVQVKISQWYCFKGPCTLDLKVTFLDGKKQPIQDVVTYRSPLKELLYHWNYLEMDTQLSFHNVRYIKFFHGSTCNENIEDEHE